MCLPSSWQRIQYLIAWQNILICIIISLIWDLVKKANIQLESVNANDQLANIFTKKNSANKRYYENYKLRGCAKSLFTIKFIINISKLKSHVILIFNTLGSQRVILSKLTIMWTSKSYFCKDSLRVIISIDSWTRAFGIDKLLKAFCTILPCMKENLPCFLLESSLSCILFVIFLLMPNKIDI